MYKSIRTLTKLIPYPDLKNSQSFVEWKNRLLFVLLVGLVFLGLLAYIPSVIISVTEELWMVVFIDTLVYLTVLYVALSKKLSSETKVKITLITFYVLGIAILILLGQAGAGFNWLFLFPLLSGFFYGYRGVVFSTVINMVSLATLTLPVHFQTEGIGLISSYGTAGWIVNSINFIVIASLVSFALAFIISNIDKSLKKEKKMIGLLRENRKELEIEKNRAEESDRLKSAFLANMSHEIRTPMNAILGFSDLISMPDLTAEKFRYYNSLIHISGEQLVRIIDDIIDISKIELNQMNISIHPMQVYSSLFEIVQIHRNKIKSLGKNIEINLEVANELKELTLETDEGRFKQIANNIVSNAVKFTDSGTITVGYKLKSAHEKTFAEFFIKDTGRGIPEDSFNLIFERFSQADNVEMKEGTGLGLSITKGLLSLLGGKIWFHSELDKGSTFYFTLPCNKLIGMPVPRIETPIKQDVVDFSGKLIYIAEDDAFSFDYLQEVLTPTRINIKQAQDGKELLRLLEEKIPDLVLLDIKMPVMGGLEALTEIRKIHPGLPVIAQTAFAMPEERQKCFDYGCNDYISKPINKQTLFKTIEPYLKDG